MKKKLFVFIEKHVLLVYLGLVLGPAINLLLGHLDIHITKRDVIYLPDKFD